MNNHIPLYLFFVGMALGSIFMAILYNLFLYIFHKERMFLYYSLMQSGIITILLYDTNIIGYFSISKNIDSTIYKIVSYLTLFFILMFIREFFNTKNNLVFMDKILMCLLLFIFLNIPFYNSFLLFEYGIYLPIFLLILYIAYLKYRDGFFLANFFIISWSIFILTIFMDSLIDFDLDITPLSFNPMIIGAVIEALVIGIIISYKFKELKDEKERERYILLQQSKLASLGELLGNIAHQWRQPLTRLGYMLMSVGVVNKSDRDIILENTQNELQYLSATIDDFINFYLPSQKKSYFIMENEIKSALSLLNLDGIEFTIEVKEGVEIYNYRNSFRQVILNLLQNSIDVFQQQNIILPEIIIKIDEKQISIIDNGGGIDGYIEKIFEAYFTTKENGLGIGLYMSKIIVEKQMQGKLSVQNIDDGVEFLLCF